MPEASALTFLEQILPKSEAFKVLEKIAGSNKARDSQKNTLLEAIQSMIRMNKLTVGFDGELLEVGGLSLAVLSRPA